MSRFDILSRKIQSRGRMSKEAADATAAVIGRRKYGKKRFQEMAAAGRRKKRTKGRQLDT